MVRDSYKERSLSFWILKASTLFRSYLLKILKKKGFKVTPEQFSVLYELQKQDGLYQRQIADKVNKNNPNMTRIIDILEKDRLIKRKVDKDDRRKFKIYITPEGENLVKEIYPIIYSNRQKLEQIITKTESEVLISSLQRIIELVKNIEEELNY